MTTPMLALPPAGRERPRNLITTSTAVALAGMGTFFMALVGSWFYVKHLNQPWTPKGFKLDNYLGTMLSITSVMAAVTVEWAVYASRKDDKSQSAFAMGMTAVFGLAILNLLWFLGRGVGFGPGKTPYAVVFFAMISAAGFMYLVGVVVAIAAMARTLGRQMSSTDHEMLRATAMYWQFAFFAWAAIWMTVWWIG